MARMCDLCGKKTGWRAFHCQDGVICKDCYKIVSNHYTTTVTGKTLAELRKDYRQNAAPLDLGEDGFLTSRRVGGFLLLDETRRKFCIPSNRRITGQVARPEIYRYEDLTGYMLACEPSLPPERLEELAANPRETVVIDRMVVRLRLKNAGVRELIVIPSPVRSSSFAFRRAYRAAGQILRELEEIC